MPLEDEAGVYDRTTIALHWATAALVVVLWSIGQTADWFADGGPVNTGLWSVHVLLGFVLAAVLGVRIAWRGSRGRGLPAADPGLLHVVATHYLLYVLLVSVMVLGVINAFVRGYNLFNVAHLPQFGDRAWRKPITEWHGLAANALLVVAMIHAGAALIHHYVWRDGVLRRMLTVARRSERKGVLEG